MPEYPSKSEELTYDERATWGTCPICNATPGQWCDGEIGLRFGGQIPHHGVHIARLQAAPTKRVISYVQDG